MSATKTERRCGPSLALVACAMLSTLALSVPATAFLMQYFSQEGEQGNAPVQVEATSLDGTAEAFQHGRRNSRLRERHQHEDVIKPAVHLMGMDPSNLNHKKTLVWKQVFSNHEAEANSFSLVIPHAGFYYVYFQVGFRNGSCHRSSLTLHSELYKYHSSYKEDILLLQAMETVCSHGNHATVWYTSINQGALVKLDKNHHLSVKVSHPDLVDYRGGYTFFGAMAVP